MNISELHVDDFGAWHNLTLDDLSESATVFYGRNEAGKTTLLNLIRTVLYGFSEKRCKKYLPPAQGAEAGGSLSISDINGRYSLHRSAPSNYRGGEGTFRVSSADGGKHGKELLTTLLAGVDETIFNNVFAVGLSQMQQLATLSDTEAAEQLYGLATGVDRVSLGDVTRELETRRCSLLTTPESERATTQPGAIDRLIEQRQRLQRELKALRRDEEHFARLRSDHRKLTKSITDREKSRKLLDARGDWAEISAEIRKRWARCKKINTKLEDIGAIIDIPQHVMSRVKAIDQNIRQRRREWEKLRDERKTLRQRAAKLSGGHALYPHAAEIEAIDRQRARVVALDHDVKAAKTTVEELEFELQAEMEELGLQTGTSAKRLPAISDEIIEALRIPAREARQLKESVEALKRLAAERRKEAEQVKGQLETAAVRFGGQEIGDVLDRSVTLVKRLERRIDLDEQREGLVRRLDETQDEASYWQGRTLLPWRGVLAVCGIFSGGVAALATGALNNWFTLDPGTGMPMMLIGGSLALVSLVIKNSFENSAEERVDFFHNQLDLLQDEQELANEEVAQLEKVLEGKGHYDQQLIDARQEMEQLSMYLPLNQRLRDATREADAAEHEATLAVRQLKDARLTWKASLRAVGLPDSLTPTQIGAMRGRVSGVTQLRTRINDARREQQDREQELETIRERIQQLLIVGQVIDAPDTLAGQLSRLVTELGRHSRSGRERDQLRERWDELGEKQKRVAGAAQQLYRHRRQLLEGHGISSPAELRDTVSRAGKAEKLRGERDHWLNKISEMAGEEFALPKLQKMLDRRSNALLEQLSRIDEERETLGADLNDLQQRAGQLKQKLDGHMSDRRGEQKELEIRVLDEKIRRASERWHHAATVSAVLDSVKQNYETRRQPVALAEASRHLDRLTEGRYTRIWTPMGQSALCIDDAHGTALPVEKLSRGTRELVFLALRLALVSSYNRRGANMPIVLDDVFVNFDDTRARAAAAVLYDLAKSGQQMLIFTCHERIRDIFGDMGADVRDLPARTGVAKRAQPIEPEEPVQEPQPVASPAADAKPIATVERAEASLPIYDAEAWDEAVEQLAIGLPVARKKAVEAPPAIVVEDVFEVQPDSEEQASAVRHLAWRDEWLDPLPDLADSE